ncbi:MAG: hypothetical protein EOP24_44475 [Hyphomicrobiales bacterium]|nr:MAG: hypothetical protein EOP24_44475 [Hyphomicrobiales bacterium]
MDPTPDKVLFLFLGWLLGMLSPVIVSAVTRRRDNALGRAAILTELNDLAATLAIAVYGVRSSLGTVDRPFLEWLRAFLETHPIPEGLKRLQSNLPVHLSWSDEDIEKGAKYMASAPGTSAMLQRYPVPLLDARVSALWTFDTDFQRRLLEIRRNVALLDDIVDRSRKYFDLTFTNLEGENHQLVRGNLNQCYELYAERATMVVEKIADLRRKAG